MKIFKKLILTIILIVATMLLITNISKATTVEVTTDNLNFRREASTDSEIIMALFTGYKCELIAEEGSWYKVKYLGLEGYISKDYAKKQQTAEPETPTQKPQETSQHPEETDQQPKVTTVNKVLRDTDLKILPLIYSSKISTLKKNTEVTVINNASGWIYIQTDTVSGWIRKDAITTETKTATTENKQEGNNVNVTNNETNNTKYEEKTAYINETAVNVRKSAIADSDIIKVLALNTEVKIIGEEKDWYKVKSGDDIGYIAKRLISEKKVETTSRSAEVRTTVEKNNNQNNNITTSNETNNTTTSSAKGEEIVKYAKQYLDCPYVYGAAGPDTFDCSGFTMYIYKHFGVSLPHGATSQSYYGTNINAKKDELKSKLKAGDLVFFLDYPSYEGIGHVGIYIGDGNFIHASSGTGYCVKISTLLDGGYYDRYTTARRIF